MGSLAQEQVQAIKCAAAFGAYVVQNEVKITQISSAWL